MLQLLGGERVVMGVFVLVEDLAAIVLVVHLVLLIKSTRR